MSHGSRKIRQRRNQGPGHRSPVTCLASGGVSTSHRDATLTLRPDRAPSPRTARHLHGCSGPTVRNRRVWKSLLNFLKRSKQVEWIIYTTTPWEFATEICLKISSLRTKIKATLGPADRQEFFLFRMASVEGENFSRRVACVQISPLAPSSRMEGCSAPRNLSCSSAKRGRWCPSRG